MRHSNGREVTVSLRDLASLPQDNQFSEYRMASNEPDANCDDSSVSQPASSPTSSSPNAARNAETPAPNSTPVSHAQFYPIRSARSNKGVPLLRYGVHDESA